jgi:hypothetical protein
MFEQVRDGKWRTLSRLSSLLKMDEDAIYQELKQEKKSGRYIIERKRKDEKTFKFRIFAQKQPAIFNKYPFETLRKGCTCSECGRSVKIDRRYLNSTAINNLSAAYENSKPNGEFYFLVRHKMPVNHTKKDLKNNPDADTTKSGDVSLLLIWGLIERGTKRGYFRITQNGVDFVEGRINVHAAAFIENYKARFVAWDKEAGFYTFAQAQRHGFKEKEL